MPYEIERRFLIARPDLLNLANLCKIQKISQTYLTAREGSVRVRRLEEKGQVSYIETAKRSISAIKRQELELPLTEEEYNRRLAQRDPRRQTIHIVKKVDGVHQQHEPEDRYRKTEPWSLISSPSGIARPLWRWS